MARLGVRQKMSASTSVSKSLWVTRCSKLHFDPELHLPGRLRAEDPPEVRRAIDAIRDVEVHTVEEIENLPAKFQTSASSENDVLLHARVDVGVARRQDCIASGIAKCEWRRQRKRGGVEPLFGGSRAADIRIAGDVGPLRWT